MKKYCQNCCAELKKEHKTCPVCGTKYKPPFYKLWWLWLLIIILIGVVFASDSEYSLDSDDYYNEDRIEELQDKYPEATKDEIKALIEAEDDLEWSNFSRDGLIDWLKEEGFTVSEAEFALSKLDVDWNKQAEQRADSYLMNGAYSYGGLIDQLEYDKFTPEQAKHGADSVEADWNEQAAKKAKTSLKYSAYSYEGLYDALIREEFTPDQAKQAVDNCGADWNEQAVRMAKSYLKNSKFTRDRLIDQLLYEQFTKDQAVYGVEQNGL